MFLKYLEPIFKPWRMMRNTVQSVRTVKGNIVGEVGRVQRFGNVTKAKIGQVKQMHGQAQQAQGQLGKMQGQVPGSMPGAPAQVQGQMQGNMPSGQMPNMHMQPPPGGQPGAGMPGHPVAFNPNPPIKVVGFFRRRKICTQCNNQLDKSWDSCPYCAQAANQQPSKTAAFMVDTAGAPSKQLLGWIVPVDGPHRGELYTLAPNSVIGTEPTCQVVLDDQFMSSRHAEINAEGGVWIVKDLGSTNGTYVNDRRVDQQELVDNDFVQFGKSVVKFKSL